MKTRKHQRLQGFDYHEENLYFVTTTTQHRIHHFGRIREGRMVLSIPGEIAHKQWEWLAAQYSYLEIHDFVVMPNHVHALLQICQIPGAGRADRSGPAPGPKIKPLSELMGAYKTTVSKQIHLAGFSEFKWQRSFHDHIIRDERAFEHISSYIISNPQRWEGDSFYSSS